jgi:hypothetical protein
VQVCPIYYSATLLHFSQRSSSSAPPTSLWSASACTASPFYGCAPGSRSLRPRSRFCTPHDIPPLCISVAPSASLCVALAEGLIDCLLSSRLHAYRRRSAARYTSASPSHLSTGRATSKSRRRSSGCISARCTSAGILRGPGRSPLTSCESDRVGERGLRPCSDASRSNPIQRGSTPKLACSSVFVYLEYW